MELSFIKIHKNSVFRFQRNLTKLTFKMKNGLCMNNEPIDLFSSGLASHAPQTCTHTCTYMHAQTYMHTQNWHAMEKDGQHPAQAKCGGRTGHSGSPGAMGSVLGPCQQALRTNHRPSVYGPLCPVRMEPGIPIPISSREKKGRKLEIERRNESKRMEGRRKGKRPGTSVKSK